MTISNWGNFPKIEGAEIPLPIDLEETRKILGQNKKIIARGNGRSYGDASLGNVMLSTQYANKILQFDEKSGLIQCESGTLLSDILNFCLPQGWFFHVTPGTRLITVGGAIASDVHGKNHSKAGNFSNYLHSFTLLNGKGEIQNCSRNENEKLFWQTCGGMGLTGIILTATFQMRRISSNSVKQITQKTADFETLFKKFEAAAEQHEFNAAWIDCVTKGKNAGRGVLFSGDFEGVKLEKMERLASPHLSVPFFAPNFLLNNATIYAWNLLYYYTQKSGTSQVPISTFFYPLDALSHWNRLYGRRGFIQYQALFPQKTAFEALQKTLEIINVGNDLPFLTVLKKHGKRPDELKNSFPDAGYSLALDFPKTKTVFDLVKKLDKNLEKYGGKVYLAKDACSSPQVSGLDFSQFKDTKFSSHLKERLFK